MRNINNRAKKLNGVIETKSPVGEGTTVTLVIKKVEQFHG
jgi:signal transduction histidine kinase